MKTLPHSSSNTMALVDFQEALDSLVVESILKTLCVEVSSGEDIPGDNVDNNSSSEDTPLTRSVSEEIRECVLIFDAGYQFRYSDYVTREPNGLIWCNRFISFLNC